MKMDLVHTLLLHTTVTEIVSTTPTEMRFVMNMKYLAVLIALHATMRLELLTMTDLVHISQMEIVTVTAIL
jgi:hypothetical protein